MTTRAPGPRVLLVIGIVLLAANMRSGITCVGPLLDRIRGGTHLSGTGAGVLSTLPLLAFAGVSLLAPRLAQRLGFERSLLAAVVAIAAGTFVRSLPGIGPLYGGTVLLGAAIACVNVLLPGLLKRDFPGRVAVMTATYATTMSLVAAISSGVAVPIADAAPGGWRTALGCWTLLAVVAAGVWLPQTRSTTRPAPVARHPLPWGSALAWQVTAFMGLQSFCFYAMIAWLPSVLQAHGESSAAAGWALFGYQMVSLLASAATPSIAARMRDQRLLAAVGSVATLLGFTGLAVAPAWATLWVAVAGIASGITFTLALSLFALRAVSSGQAAALSGMSQSAGYLFAAAGPVLFGLLHDASNGWTASLLLVCGIAAAQIVSGALAGRDRTIAPAPREGVAASER